MLRPVSCPNPTTIDFLKLYTRRCSEAYNPVRRPKLASVKRNPRMIEQKRIGWLESSVKYGLPVQGA